MIRCQPASDRWIFLLVFSLFLSACTSAPKPQPLLEQQAERLLERGVMAYQQSEYLMALHFFQRALVDYQGFDQRYGQLHAQLNLAQTLLQLGRLAAAQLAAEEAFKLASALLEPSLKAQAQWLLAQKAWLNQQPEKTRQLLVAILPSAKQLKTQPPTKVELAALALQVQLALDAAIEPEEVGFWLGRYQEALARLEAPSSLHNLRLQRFQAQELARVGKEEAATAIALLEKVLIAYRKEARRPAIAATLTELGAIYLQVEQVAQAEEAWQRALRVRLQLNDALNSHRLLLQLAALYHQQEQVEAAEQAREQAARFNSF